MLDEKQDRIFTESQGISPQGKINYKVENGNSSMVKPGRYCLNQGTITNDWIDYHMPSDGVY